MEEGLGLPTRLLGEGSWELWPEMKLRFQLREVGGGVCWVRPVIGLQSLLATRKAKVQELGKGRSPPYAHPNAPSPRPRSRVRVQPLASGGSVRVLSDPNRCWTQEVLYPKSACKASGDQLANSWT